jgi:hypothetical protein
MPAIEAVEPRAALRSNSRVEALKTILTSNLRLRRGRKAPRPTPHELDLNRQFAAADEASKIVA